MAGLTAISVSNASKPPTSDQASIGPLLRMPSKATTTTMPSNTEPQVVRPKVSKMPRAHNAANARNLKVLIAFRTYQPADMKMTRMMMFRPPVLETVASYDFTSSVSATTNRPESPKTRT